MVKYNKKTGFTLAEALISMLIVAIIIGVSMKVFTKKHVKPIYNASHGFYVCYNGVDDAGVDAVFSKKGAAAPVRQEEDSCTFTPVKSANYYVVYAVGGGGGGNGTRGGAPGEFKTLFLTNIADPIQITPGLAGVSGTTATATAGGETTIKNSRPEVSGGPETILSASGGLPGGADKMQKKYIKKCTVVPNNNFFSNATEARNYITYNLTDNVKCEVTNTHVNVELCNARYTDVEQSREIFSNTDSFWEKYKTQFAKSTGEDLTNLFARSHTYFGQSLDSITAVYGSGTATTTVSNCLRYFGNSPQKTCSPNDMAYCFGSVNEGIPDRLYKRNCGAGVNAYWYLAGYSSAALDRQCKKQTRTIDTFDPALGDSEIVIRNIGEFKVILELYYDLTKRNITAHIVPSGFGDYLINSGFSNSAENLFFPDLASKTGSPAFTPSMGDGGASDTNGFSGAVFIAW